ncbi:Alpha/Beta hydrolase protein [Roridomyces roridus]|uniref:Alpha/Beta hydrolase protein n=1 Tax=Roridomyces roridus TaxID=1738132 RepID=A0AAD7BLU2_9AGAR|nr:Alpha/Beta hydrolase protein [Roridomyces roridus]
MSFCDNCFKAIQHDGSPEGEMTTLGGVPCYVATPPSGVEYPKDKVLLFLTDAWGLELRNSKLLADDYARNGFKTVVPDLFNGDPVPMSQLAADAPAFDWPSWLPNHAPAQTRPLIDAVMGALKAEGVTGFAAAGYCFGARETLDLAFDNAISVAVIAHPSRLKVPADLETYLTKSTAPLLINSCTHDPVFPPASQAQADVILGGGAFAPGYKRNYYEGCAHGFSVRGDLSDPVVKKAKEEAFEESVGWIKKYF